MSIISVRRLSKSFRTPEGARPVLEDVSFEVSRGQFFSVFGPNGSGKSTLMAMLAGLQNWDAGSLDIALERSRIVPMVFQDYRRSLFPWLDVRDNVLYPLRIAGVPARIQAERFDKLVSLVQPTFGFSQRVAELSGGEAQTVSLLRALIVEPEVLVCDEPTSALDYQASITLVQRLMEVTTELGITVVFVGHDLDEVLYAGDEVLFLSKRPGRVVGQLRVDLPRPRTMSLQTGEGFAALKSQALKLFDLCISEPAAPAHFHG